MSSADAVEDGDWAFAARHDDEADSSAILRHNFSVRNSVRHEWCRLVRKYGVLAMEIVRRFRRRVAIIYTSG